MRNLIIVFCFLFFVSTEASWAQSRQSQKAKANQYLRDARIYRADGASDQSMALLRRAAPIFKELEIWGKYFRTESLRSKYFEDEEVWDSVKAIQEKILLESVRYLGKNNRFELRAYISLGEVHQKRAEYSLAERYLEEGLSLIDRKPVGKQDLRTEVNSQLGAVYAAEGKLEKALKAFEAAELASEKKPFAELTVIAKHKMQYAESLIKAELYEKALQFASKSLELYQTLYGQGHHKTAEVRILIGRIYAKQGVDKQALETWKIALNSLSKNKKSLPTYKNIFSTQGLFYKERGALDAAKESWKAGILFLEKEIGKHHPMIAGFYELLAETALQEKNIGEANQAIEKGLKALLPFTEDPYSADLSKEPNMSSFQLLNLLKIQQEVEWERYQNSHPKQALKEILRLFEQGQTLSHLLTLEASNAAQRHQAYLLKKEMAILAAVAAAEDQQLSKLLEAIEWSKWNWKVNTLLATASTSLKEVDEALDEQENRLAEKYQSLLRQWKKAILYKRIEDPLREELFVTLRAYNQFLQELKHDHPKHFYRFHQMPTLDEAVVRKASKNAALVLFLKSKNAYYRFYYNGEDWSFQKLQELDDLLNKSWTILKQPNLQESEALGKNMHQLYQNLLAELFTDSLPTQLQILTDGQLNAFPFEALLSTTAEGKIRKWPFLFKQVQIRYRFNLSDLLQSNSSSSTKGVLVLSSSYKDRTPLNYAAAKAWTEGYNQGNKLRKRLKAKFLLNYEATETHFREQNLNQYQAVHMGFWVETGKNFPSIYLHYEYDSIYDGRLGMNEIPATNLKLMTMAHLGDSLAIWQQQAALLMSWQDAGVEGLLWPSWELPPAQSRKLILRFYKELAEGKTKAEAWQKAMEEYLAASRAEEQWPYYWAAFRLSGQDGPVSIQQKIPASWGWLGGIAAFVVVLLIVIVWRRKRK